jgi:hypothetical protein
MPRLAGSGGAEREPRLGEGAARTAPDPPLISTVEGDGKAVIKNVKIS